MTGRELLNYLNSLSENELDLDVVMPCYRTLYFGELQGIRCFESERINDRRVTWHPRRGILVDQFHAHSNREPAGKRIFLFNGDYPV